jgi:hypothetical protein
MGVLAVKVPLHATTTVTQDLSLLGLIRRTEIHAPQWDPNPQRKVG